MSYASEDGLSVDGQHRPQDTSSSSLFGLVTKVIPPRDPKFKSDRGKRAITEEIDDLISEKVWRHETVQEWSDVRHVRKDGYTPMVGLLFLIMGQQSAELDTGLIEDYPACPLRWRGVFQGSNVRMVGHGVRFKRIVKSSPESFSSFWGIFLFFCFFGGGCF